MKKIQINFNESAENFELALGITEERVKVLVDYLNAADPKDGPQKVLSGLLPLVETPEEAVLAGTLINQWLESLNPMAGLMASMAASLGIDESNEDNNPN